MNFKVVVHIVYRKEYTVEADDAAHAERVILDRALDASPSVLNYFDTGGSLPTLYETEIVGETEEVKS